MRFGDHGHARTAQLPAEVEEIVLHVEQRRPDAFRQIFRQQHAEHRIEFVDFAQGIDTRTVLPTREPSPRPVVPASPVRVTILERRLPMVWSCRMEKSGKWLLQEAESRRIIAEADDRIFARTTSYPAPRLGIFVSSGSASHSARTRRMIVAIV